MPWVNNKVLAQTPSEVIRVRIVLYAVVLSFSGSLHGFNTANISGVLAMKPFGKTFKFEDFSSSEKTNFIGWVTSSLLLGSCAGALLCAWVTDKFGRNRSLSFFTFLYVVAAIFMTANAGGKGGKAEFLTGRVLSGLGSGAASVIGTGYIAEIAPKAIRGGLAALYNANTMLGVGMAYWINYGSLVNISSSKNAQWQVPMGVQAFPGVILMVCLWFVPESPRWLEGQNRSDQAKASLEKLRQLPITHEFVRAEYAEIAKFHQSEDGKKSKINLFCQRLSKVDFRKRLILVMIIQIFFQFSGGNIITYYNTSILTSIGLKSKTTNFLFSGIYGLVKFLTVIIYSAFFIDRFGRRPMLFAGSGIIIASLTYMSAYLALSHPSASDSTGAAGWVAVLAIYLFAIGYAISWATIPWIINAEVFPTDVRATSMAVCITWQYLVNFALTRALPNMNVAMHAYGPFALLACATTVGTVYSYFALPETRGLSLEQMEDLFQGPWYKVGRRSLAIARLTIESNDSADDNSRDVEAETSKTGFDDISKLGVRQEIEQVEHK